MGVIRCAVIGAGILALMAVFSNPVLAGDVGRAKRDLTFARDNAESGRWDSLDESMKKAAADMEGLSDADKAPLLATIAEIKSIVTKSIEAEVTKRLDKAAAAGPGNGKFDIDRATMRLNSDEAKAYADQAVIDKLKARVATMTGGTTPPPVTNTPTNTTNPPKMALTGDLAAAASRLRTARNMIEQGDRRIAEGQIKDAIRLMAGGSDAEKASLLADIASLKKLIDEADIKAQLAEEFRRVDSQVQRYISDADNGIQNGVVGYPDRINTAQKLLLSSDVTRYMDAEHLKQYQARLDAIKVKYKAHNKATALERCAANLKELEERVAADPFKGTDNISAYNVFTGIESLAWRVKKEFVLVDKDDADVKAVLDRVAAAEAKLEASAGKYAVEKEQTQFAEGWKFNSQPFAGWESEQLSPNSVAQRRIEGLNKTTQAVSGTVYWLNSADTKKTLEKYKDNAAIQAVAQEAQKTLDQASAKLNEAFNTVIADAERQPMPNREADRAQIAFLGQSAGNWFAGTKYRDANVARAAALDAKWKADVAQADKEMEQTLKKLSAEADAAWPKIEASVAAESGFNPAEADRWKGKTILIKGYWNRTGWDFDSAYDYAVGIKGIPVAGHYAPNVREAFNEGSRHTKFGINDHMGWDLIAVVEGPGKISRRVTTEWKDANTHQILFKTESLVPEPCVVIKIIGLHAGPVAVGPK